MSDVSSVPSITVTAAGAQPTPPATLRAQLVTIITALRPGYSGNLPGALIEDVLSTDTAALALIDQAAVETINSLTPLGANAFLLTQLGAMLGVPQGTETRTSVFVIFSGAPPGYTIAQGFVVSDGSHQYALADGGVIESDGSSAQLFAVATIDGTWAVAEGTVVNIVTSVPTQPGVDLTVTNPQDGVPGSDDETESEYRARVDDANLAASQGMTRYLKTLVREVAGVQARLVSARAQEGGGWEIIVGGGDPYAVAYAIFTSLFDISTLVGSTLSVTGITSANPGVVSLDLNHGYVVGQAVALADVDPSGFNGSYAVLSIPNETSFALGEAFAARNLTGLSWANTSGGQATATFGASHGVTVGSTFTITGAAPAGYNGTFVAIAGTTGTTLIWALVSNPGTETALGMLLAGIANFDATALTYISGGVATPNNRNIVASLFDYPDTYAIPYVNPPQQSVTMAVTWNTTSNNIVSAAAMAQAAVPAIVDYINSIAVGNPINVLLLEDAFEAATSSILPTQLLTRLVFAVSINGVGVDVVSGTKIIDGDPESYFFAQAAGISVVQG